jgi:DNA-binding GntR family transcriptional regulator
MPHVPDYQRIAADIRDQITTGQLHPGDQLPSITQLTQQYRVSAQPVKNALLVLQTEGWTRGRQGRGVYVVDRTHAGASPSTR